MICQINGLEIKSNSEGVIVNGNGEVCEVCPKREIPFRGQGHPEYQKWLPLANFRTYGNDIEPANYLIYVRLYLLGVPQARNALVFMGRKYGESVISATQPLTFQDYAKIKEIDEATEYLRVTRSEWDLLPFVLEQMRRSQIRLEYPPRVIFRSVAGSVVKGSVCYEPQLNNVQVIIISFAEMELPISEDRAALCLMDLHVPNVWWWVEEEVVRSEIYRRHYAHITGV